MQPGNLAKKLYACRRRRSRPPVMLPRHLRPAYLALRSVRNTPAYNAFAFKPSSSSFPSTVNMATHRPARYLHCSSRRLNEMPKSPFQTFVDVLKEELQKNRDLQQNVKQLQGDVDKFQDSEAMKRARAAYERARVCFSLLHDLGIRK